MAINFALFLAILFGYGFAQSDAAKSCTKLQAEVSLEIQYNDQVGSGVILMTSNPTSCANLVPSNPSGNISNTNTTNSALSMTSLSETSLVTSFNTPPSFGVSRTQMVNATTSTGQLVFPTTAGSSQMMAGATATQSLLESSTSSISQNSVVTAGSGARPNVSWPHIFFWAVITEFVKGFL